MMLIARILAFCFQLQGTLRSLLHLFLCKTTQHVMCSEEMLFLSKIVQDVQLPQIQLQLTGYAWDLAETSNSVVSSLREAQTQNGQINLVYCIACTGLSAQISEKNKQQQTSYQKALTQVTDYNEARKPESRQSEFCVQPLDFRYD